MPATSAVAEVDDGAGKSRNLWKQPAAARGMSFAVIHRVGRVRTSTVIALAVMSSLALFASCYSTRVTSAAEISPLRRGDHGQEIVLKQGLFGVHVGPRSWVRFALRDGNRTPWFGARHLKVNQLMVVTSREQTRSRDETSATFELRWQDVTSVEVNDLDLGRTVVGISAGTGVVMVAATTEVLLIGAIGAITGGHASGELGITRGALDMVANETFKRPEDDGDAVGHGGGDDRAGAEPAPEVRSVSVPETLQAEPLFSWRARRRDIAVFTIATEGGTDTSSAATVSFMGGITAGVRFVHLFELGVGAHSALVAPADGGRSRIVTTPFFRFGLHLDLDAARRIALAVGGDLGGLPRQPQARFVLGVRVRMTDNLQVGLYPWNPATETRTTADLQPTSNRSHISLLEVSWLL